MSVDWATISSVGTAAGTLVLAIATFSSTRAANRAGRAAELSMLASLRPLLATSRLDDAEQKVSFADDRWVHVKGGRATVEVTDDAMYFLVSLRNVGAGMAVLHGWALDEGLPRRDQHSQDVTRFHHLTRDIYIPPGELGFFQGALRDPAAPDFAAARKMIDSNERFTIELLYGDHEGGQRVITLFGVLPGEGSERIVAISQHWNLDRADPR